MLDIKAYEAMAKLALPDDERTWVAEQTGRLSRDFDTLKDIDTSAAAPLVSVLDIKNVLRDDVATKTIDRETLLANAPMEYDGYFQVPKTLA